MSSQHSTAQQGSAAQTFAEFCADNRVSRSKIYEMWHEGIGPDFFLVGKHIRFTREAGAAWRAAREAAREHNQQPAPIVAAAAKLPPIKNQSSRTEALEVEDRGTTPSAKKRKNTMRKT